MPKPSFQRQYTVPQQVQDWLDSQYAEYLQSLSMSPRTIKTYTCRARRMLSMAGVRRVEDLTFEQARDALRTISPKVSSNDLFVAFSACIHIFDTLGKEVEAGRLARLRRKHSRKRRRRGIPTRALEPDEEQRLLDVSEGIQRIAYRLALDAGMRAGEIIHAKVEWYVPEKASIYIPATHAKSGTLNIVRLPSDLNEEIRRLALRRRKRNRHGSRLYTKGDRLLYKRFQHDLRKAGIRRITPQGKVTFHSLRHTFCTRLLEQGVPPHIVQALARHASATTTLEVYAHVRNDIAKHVERRSRSSSSTGVAAAASCPQDASAADCDRGEGGPSLRLVS